MARTKSIVSKREVDRLMKAGQSIVDLSSWKSARSSVDQRISWMNLVGAMWDFDKDNTSNLRKIIEPSFFEAAKKVVVDTNKLKALSDKQISTHILIVGYLLNKGVNYQPSYDYFKREVRELTKTLPEVKAKAVSVSVQKPKEDLIGDLICAIEALEDHKLEASDFSTLSHFGPLSLTQAKKIMAYFEPRWQEYKLGLADDNDVTEGYSYTKRQFKKICDWYASLFDVVFGMVEKNLKSVQSNGKPIIRRARKKKVKSPRQLVKLFNYMQKDDQYKLSSVNPEKIIGAKGVLCFNVKKRMLMFFFGNELSVHRSSITGFDPSLSFQKKLRKPELILGKLMDGTRTFAQNQLKAIKAVESEVTGRINGDCLVLKVYNK